MDTDRGPKGLIFESIQRNKIKILLRSELIYDIIQLTKMRTYNYRRIFYAAIQ